MDKKLTDKEIIKALECCIDNTDKSCSECANSNCDCSCVDELQKNALALINRLQTENEDIKFLYKNLKEEHLEIIKAIKHTKAEAYKECIEKVKALFPSCNEPYQYWEIHEGADNLLKELVGDTDA